MLGRSAAGTGFGLFCVRSERLAHLLSKRRAVRVQLFETREAGKVFACGLVEVSGKPAGGFFLGELQAESLFCSSRCPLFSRYGEPTGPRYGERRETTGDQRGTNGKVLALPRSSEKGVFLSIPCQLPTCRPFLLKFEQSLPFVHRCCPLFSHTWRGNGTPYMGTNGGLMGNNGSQWESFGFAPESSGERSDSRRNSTPKTDQTQP